MASKSRSKSSGSVSPYSTKAGKRYRWQAFVPLEPHNPSGPKARKGKGKFLTYQEAFDDMQLALSNVRNNLAAVPGEELFGDYATAWLETRQLENATRQGYEKILRVHLIPQFGKAKLIDVTAVSISRFYNKLRIDGNKGKYTKGKPLSENSISKIHVLLGSILELARLEGKVKNNEARQNPKVVNAPTGKSIRKGQEELRPWTVDQVKSFLAWNKNIQNDDFFPLWRLYLFSGLRRGEAVALKWEDVNFESGKVRVRRASDSGLRKAVKKTKTLKERVVPIDADTLKALEDYKTERGKLGPDFVSPDAFIFGTLDGTVRNPGDVGERWNKTISKALTEVPNLHHLTIKGMRHTHATLLLESGAKMKAVQERLGHSNITTTLNIYSHSTETMQEEAVQLLLGNF